MLSTTKTITSLVCLAAVTFANPIHTDATKLASRWTDCPAGEQWYTCANGYKGCYSKDPCALPSKTSTTPSSTAACPTGTAKAKVNKPTMYNLHPSQPELAGPSVSHLEVQAGKDVAPLEQVAVFKGIPEGAKYCTLGWSQADAANRNFTVTGDGLITVSQLTGFPADGEPVSSTSVAPFEDPAAPKTTPDFTEWDKSQGASDHMNGPLTCGTEMYLKLAKAEGTDDGHVYLEQDDKNGLFVQYSC
ncbi:hypothetical protein F4779DRAFT_611826 [Xylariaceae sp. FL0662B]|nr:hypothetical protein F4779DRAFT_611826 [Xylariaceae sp. FL0662B]